MKYKTQDKHTNLYIRIKPLKYFKVMFQIINFIVYMLALLLSKVFRWTDLSYCILHVANTLSAICEVSCSQQYLEWE